MVILENNILEFRFPEIHREATCKIELQRTLRAPVDGNEHQLPDGHGQFPLLHVDDFSKKLPPSWTQIGGVFLPMYQSEALWIRMISKRYPFAVKIAAGKVNALTGANWSNNLCRHPQDYVVLPRQSWVDGFCVRTGVTRQFVAMPLGSGFTAEEQNTGLSQCGGIQVVVYPMKPEFAIKYLNESEDGSCEELGRITGRLSITRTTSPSMGLARGGLLRQRIFADEYGEGVWETKAWSRCFIHLLNSEQYRAVTGKNPPGEPPGSDEYSKAGLPWSATFAGDRRPLLGGKLLSGLFGAGEKDLPTASKVIGKTENFSR